MISSDLDLHFPAGSGNREFIFWIVARPKDSRTVRRRDGSELTEHDPGAEISNRRRYKRHLHQEQTISFY